MIVRLRSPLGMKKLNVEPSSTLQELKWTWASSMMPENPDGSSVVVSESPDMNTIFLDDESTLAELGIQHGHLLFVDTESAVAAAAASAQQKKRKIQTTSSSTSTTSSTTTTKSAGGSVKEEGAKENEITGKPKCNHPSHAKCPNCLDSDSNNINSGINRCNHSSNSRCPNCLPKPSASEIKKQEKEKELARQKELRRREERNKDRCMHGPNGMCAYCAPTTTFQDELEFDARVKAAGGNYAQVRPRCTRHGTNGSCVACESWIDQQRLRMKREERADLRFYLSTAAGRQFTQLALQSARPVAALLLGYTKDKKHKKKIFVEAIYEIPSSTYKDGTVKARSDPNDELVRQAAGWFGWRVVGWAFVSSSPESFLSAKEVQQTLQLNPAQSHHLPFLAVAFKRGSGGQMSVEAFTLSAQALKLHRQGLVKLEQESGQALALTQPVYLEQSQATEVPIPFFLVPVRVFQFDGQLKAQFPGLQRNPTLNDMKAYFVEFNQDSFLNKLKDFNLLLFIAKSGYLDRSTDLPVLSEAIMSNDSSNIEGFKLILSSILELEL